MFGWLKRLFGRGGAGEQAPVLKSLVWLLEKPRLLTSDSLLILARQTFGEDLIDVHQAPPNPELQGDMFLVIIRPKYAIGVISAHRPYVENPHEAAEEITELRRQALFARHTAWLAADLMSNLPAKAGYDAAARLLAALAGPDCLLLYSTEKGYIEPYDEHLPERLLQGKPLQTLKNSEYAPVVGRPDDDEALAAAASEAERMWPEFEAEFQAQKPGCENFAVKAAFDTASGTVEWIWLGVHSIDGDTIRGEIGNDPVDVPGLKFGSEVEVARDRTQDWMYFRNGKMVGGYTVKVLMGG